MTCYFDAWCALSREAQATWVLATFSVLGFFTARGIAIGQFRSARTIAKASVRPRLNFAMRIHDDVVRLSLENNGLGPAINKEVDLFLDGKKLSDASYKTLEGAFKALDLVFLKPEGERSARVNPFEAGQAKLSSSSISSSTVGFRMKTWNVNSCASSTLSHTCRCTEKSLSARAACPASRSSSLLRQVQIHERNSQ